MGGDAEWLDGGFSAGDLMVVDVLRRLAVSGLLQDAPNLAAYVACGKSRSAFKRAFAAQRAFVQRNGHRLNMAPIDRFQKVRPLDDAPKVRFLSADISHIGPEICQG